MSLFRCPICAQPLCQEPGRYVCPSGHSYDRAAAGYVHLLPAQQKHSKLPGDDKEMARARKDFLSEDYYRPLCQALEELADRYTGMEPVVVDSGCGEGYYTAGIFHRLTAAGKKPTIAGIDLSKFALRWAAKRAKEIEFAVASAYHLPIADGQADLFLNCFAPLALDEVRRVLKPGGIFLYVVPAAWHLWELKETLYERPYLNVEERTPYAGFTYQEVQRVERVIHLPDQQTIQNLFRMTPYFWKTPGKGKAKLEQLTELDVRTQFDIHVFAREEA